MKEERQQNIIQNQEVTKYKSFSTILAMACCYQISFLFYGYSATFFTSIPYQQIRVIFQIQDQSAFLEGFLNSVPNFGSILGSIALEFLLQKISRRQSFFVLNSFLIIATCMILIRNFYTLLFGRMLQGFCIGIITGLSTIMTKQISPIQVSGLTGGIWIVFMSTGLFFGFFFTEFWKMFYSFSQLWVFTFSFPILTTLIQTLLLIFIYKNETPKYYLEIGHFHEAKSLIQQIYCQQYSEQIYNQKLQDLQISKEAEQNKKIQYPKDDWKAIFIAVFLTIFVQLTGTSVFLVYSVQIILSFLPDLGVFANLFIGIFRIACSFIALFTLEKFGRRPILLWGAMISAIALLTFGIGMIIQPQSQTLSKIVTLSSIFIYTGSIFITIIPLMWLYLAEILQPNIMPFVITANWLTGSIMLILFPMIKQSCGNKQCPQLFFVFSLFLLIEWFVFKIFVVETKDKNELQIRQEFHTKKIC